MDEVTIRHFEADDAEAVAELIRATLFTTNAPDYEPSVLEGLAAWYSPAGLVSRIGHATRLVACDAAHPTHLVATGARRENMIEGFFVHPEAQRLGIGSGLLAALEADAQYNALRALWLHASVTAVPFYEARGYTAVTEPRDFGEGMAVEMRKEFSDAAPKA